MHIELFAGGVAAVVGAIVILVWRVRETQRPVTTRKIVIPPLGMSTGLAMFLLPQLRIPVAWALCALGAGAVLLAYPLIKTSRLTRNGDAVMLQRGRAFMWILFGLLAVRMVARAYIGRFVSPTQTAAIFFLLAYGMIVRWRATMWFQYRALLAQPAEAIERADGLTP